MQLVRVGSTAGEKKNICHRAPLTSLRPLEVAALRCHGTSWTLRSSPSPAKAASSLSGYRWGQERS